jgi:hypothetical protein
LANDVDPDGDTLTITNLPVTSTSGVTLTIVGSNVTYPALSGAPYVDTFTYKAFDGADSSSAVTVTVNVINVAPIANNDAVTIHWNNTVTVSVLDNDWDLNPTDGPLLAIEDVTVFPTKGSYIISGNRRDLIYTPTPGFVGVDTLQYRTRDPYSGISSAATLTITVTNSAPLARDDSYSVKWGNTLIMDVLLNDTSVDGDYFQLLSTSLPARAVITNGKIVYTSTAMSGPETFTYTITDFNREHTATVTVNVLNNAPVPANDVATVHWKSTGITINALDNDVDADNDPLSISSVTGFNTTFGLPSVVSNAIQYVPSHQILGTNSFTYTVTDTVAPRTASVQVTITNANQPTAANKAFNIHWRTANTRIDVVTSAQDADGDDLTVTKISNPASGTAVLQTDGTTGLKYFQYNTPALFTGAVSWQYKVSDGLASSDKVGTISGTVYNNAPTGQNFSGSYLPYGLATSSGTSFAVINSANDVNPADIPFLVVKSVSQGSNGGIVTISGDFKSINYRATAAGTDTFSYVINDGLSDSITYYISITTGASTLGASDKFYTMHWRDVLAGKSLDITYNVTSADHNNKHVWLKETPPLTSPHGSFVYNASYIRDDATAHSYGIIYTPTPGYLGADSFVVATTVVNPGAQVDATITVTTQITNTKPTAPAISATTHWNSCCYQFGCWRCF